MVFKRNTLRNTKTFKQSTSINTSNINTGNTNIKPIVQKRKTYTAGSGSGEWAVSDSIKSILDPLPQTHANIAADQPPIIGKTPPANIDENFTVPDGKEEAVWYNPLSWFGNIDLGPGTNPNYTNREADATPPPPVVAFNDDELKQDLKPLGPMTQGAQAGGWHKQEDGIIKKATQPSGSTPGLIKDYVNNEQRSSFYNLPSHVSQSAHQAALDKQSMYQFENSIQKSFTTMIRDSGPDNRFNQNNFDALKTKINQSNISDKNKKNLISEYTNKITNYQKAAGGYGTDTPWAFGTSTPKNPNKAEKLKKKIESGEQVSDKEMKQFSILTQTPLGSNLKKDQNFGGYEQFL